MQGKNKTYTYKSFLQYDKMLFKMFHTSYWLYFALIYMETRNLCELSCKIQIQIETMCKLNELFLVAGGPQRPKEDRGILLLDLWPILRILIQIHFDMINNICGYRNI